jgi:hypothetical protein
MLLHRNRRSICNLLNLAYVVSYLEKTFYNLTTVSLHNWRTYGEMRALAEHKFDAETVDDNLPAQTLEQVKIGIHFVKRGNVLLGRDSPNSYQDFIRTLLPVSTT